MSDKKRSKKKEKRPRGVPRPASILSRRIADGGIAPVDQVEELFRRAGLRDLAGFDDGNSRDLLTDRISIRRTID